MPVKKVSIRSLMVAIAIVALLAAQINVVMRARRAEARARSFEQQLQRERRLAELQAAKARGDLERMDYLLQQVVAQLKMKIDAENQEKPAH